MQQILEDIKKYNNIVITRHTGPDPDALCSQFALRKIIKLNFPNKEVLAVGMASSKFKYLPRLDSPKNINGGLLIVLDTPDKKRVDIKSIEEFDKSIKIDHHPFYEKICDYEYIDDKASSVCEIVLDFAYTYDLIMDEEVASLLFMGIVSDTNRFLYSTTAKTHALIAKLLYDYDIDTKELYNNVFLRPLKEIKLQGYIEQNLTITENGLAYIVLTDEIIKDLGVDVASAGNLINNFNNIEGVYVWVMISEDVKNNMFKFNVRSRGPVINSIAEHYNGGGHKYAAGCRVFKEEDIQTVIKELDEVCMDYKSMIEEV